MRTRTSIALALLLLPASSLAARDPWFAKDKYLHLGASAAIATGGYALGAYLWGEPGPALATGAALALGAGVGKELLDLAGMGHPSWKDLAWDVAGTGAGLALAWSAHALLRSSADEPALAILPGRRQLALRWSW